ncbi:hypothetical protein LWI29_006896 [Acer saccharum]|uniref:UDP N-acetylglucosamine O-acyltransferase C-terminal domain-containing protein n=1 Tax=Acer saccharum TaxID=4024 RepID=A0AA39RBY4_ACESA|nr:hypothetical protein LWI29_006896 [Acer saccharum]
MTSVLKIGKLSRYCLSSLSLRRFFTTVPYVSGATKETSSFIHPNAVVHPNAIIGQGVSIGPFCTIGSSAKLGDGCQLYPGSHIFGNTELGEQCILLTGAVVGDDLPGRTVFGCNNIIGHHAVVGVKCQDMKYESGDECFLHVGNNNEIREHASIHRSSRSSDRTVIGDNNLIMGSCHIAHDCKIGNGNIFANNTLLAGHVVVECCHCRTILTLQEPLLFISFAVLAHFLSLAGVLWYDPFLFSGPDFSIYSVILCNEEPGFICSQDVPKYTMVAGERAELRGLNLEGLRRRGFTITEIKSLRAAYRKIFMPVDTNAAGFENRLTEVEEDEKLGQKIAVEYASSDNGAILEACSILLGNYHFCKRSLANLRIIEVLSFQ